MKRFSTIVKGAAILTSGMMFQLGRGCLPDNFYSDKLGEIYNGRIIGVLNLLLNPTGIQI